MMKRMSTLLLLVISAAVLFGQFVSENVDYISAISPGPANSHVIHDNYAYVANGMHVSVVDLSDPTNPVLANRFITPYEILSIKANENLLFTANERQGFSIYDISDPLSPVTLSTTLTSMETFDVIPYENYLYVSANWRIYIYDIENPSAPELIFEQTAPGECEVVTIEGEYLYVSYACNGIMVFDISTPDTLVEHMYWDFINTKEIEIYGDYVIGLSHSTVEALKIWDISSPDTAVCILHSGSRTSTVDIMDDYLAFSSGDEVYIFDISALPIIDTVAVLPEYSDYSEVTFYDGYLYVSAPRDGFNSVDISDITTPTSVANLELFGSPYDVCIKDTLLYAVFDPDIIKVYNISDINNPIEIGSYTADSYVNIADNNDNYLVIAVASRGLEIVDISDPAAPTLVGNYVHPRYFNSLKVEGNYAFIGDNIEELVIVDLTDPTAPVEAATLENDGDVYGIDVVGDYLFLAIEWDGLDIYDISDPYSPVLVSSTEFDAQVRGLTVFNNFAYIPTLYDGFTVFDVSDLTAPELAGDYRTMGFGDGIAVDSNYVYMSRFCVFDNSDPYDSEELGYFEFSTTTRDIELYEDYVIIANQMNGVIALQYNEIVPMEYDIILNTGWNILSYPFESSMALTTLPDILIGNAFEYSSTSRSYYEVTEISAGAGSWVISTADSFYHVEASDPVESIELDIYPGWNLVGGNASAVSASFFDSYSEILTPIYNYNSGSRSYDEADSLRPFKGYWILATDSVTITIE